MRAISASRRRHTAVGAALLWVFLCVTFSQRINADVARPPGTGTGPSVARVHLLGGADCQIRASGKTFPAAQNLPLLATDEMIVPFGAFLLVALNNGHLVRIDEDITLRVNEIVLLNAPPTHEGMMAQLDRLLTKKERTQAERISGVQARRQAADELPVESAEPKHPGRPAPSRGLEVDPLASSAAPPPPPAIQPPPPKAIQPAPGRPSTPTVQPPPPPPTLEDKKPLAKNSSEAEKETRGKIGRKQSEPSEPPSIALPKLDQTKKCLQDALLPSIARVIVEVKLHAGQVARVRLRGGLVTPACMSKLLLKHPLQGPEETWLRSEIVLR